MSDPPHCPESNNASCPCFNCFNTLKKGDECCDECGQVIAQYRDKVQTGTSDIQAETEMNVERPILGQPLIETRCLLRALIWIPIATVSLLIVHAILISNNSYRSQVLIAESSLKSCSTHSFYKTHLARGESKFFEKTQTSQSTFDIRYKGKTTLYNGKIAAINVFLSPATSYEKAIRHIESHNYKIMWFVILICVSSTALVVSLVWYCVVPKNIQKRAKRNGQSSNPVSEHNTESVKLNKPDINDCDKSNVITRARKKEPTKLQCKSDESIYISKAADNSGSLVSGKVVTSEDKCALFPIINSVHSRESDAGVCDAASSSSNAFAFTKSIATDSEDLFKNQNLVSAEINDAASSSNKPVQSTESHATDNIVFTEFQKLARTEISDPVKSSNSAESNVSGNKDSSETQIRVTTEIRDAASLSNNAFGSTESYATDHVDFLEIQKVATADISNAVTLSNNAVHSIESNVTGNIESSETQIRITTEIRDAASSSNNAFGSTESYATDHVDFPEIQKVATADISDAVTLSNNAVHSRESNVAGNIESSESEIRVTAEISDAAPSGINEVHPTGSNTSDHSESNAPKAKTMVPEKKHKFDEKDNKSRSQKSFPESNIMDLLNMSCFYPHKLSWADVVKLKGVNSSIGFLVVEKLMMSDYKASYAAFEALDKSVERGDLNEETIEKNTTVNLRKFKKRINTAPKLKQNRYKLHPMDVMNTIYNCCDNIVLQTLMEKLYVCRLSIPLLLPDPHNATSTFLLWSLRGIVPTWKMDNNELREMPIVDIPQTIISFMRIGRLHVSKSKVLNELLNPKHHDTFYHRDCDYGMSPRITSCGTVEATWYLPSEGENTGLKKMFTVLNLRGDSTDHPAEAKCMCSFSELVFLMINFNDCNVINSQDLFVSIEFLKVDFVLCFIAESIDQVKQYPDSQDKVESYLADKGVQIYESICNWNDERLCTVGEWKHEIRNTIDSYLNSANPKTTLYNVVDTARNYGFFVDEDDLSCQEAYSEIKKLTDSIEGIKPAERKLQILPLHGKLWKTFGDLVKEQNRNKPPDHEVNKFVERKETERNLIRNQQYECLQSNKRTFIFDIISQLSKKDILKKQYFLHWLHIGLNKSSISTMPALQSKYYEKLKEIRKQWSDSLDESTKMSLKTELDKLDRELEDASFGVEHIFREFGQMYEATDSYRRKKTLPEKYQCISNLPSIVASLVLQGFPFELMDGDAAFVPITWVKAVLGEVSKHTKDKKIFVISVVGIQSSGKSTLLNTMFGLKFQVSAGRCTRGLYCLMVPVDKQSMIVDYDFILIIDTEGLRAPELQDISKNHDNELATLVIGLGDVTIVNIKGENVADINDVLQIVIHAMIRMSIAKPELTKPSCMFVHQNVSAVDAGEKLKIEQEKLLSKLDKITAGAAKEERRTDIHHFKDVITYDEHNYSFFMPDLWQGQPPMAPVNWGYSDKVNKIKTILTQKVVSGPNLLTVSRFSSKISDLWDAILLEDFVFSFRNSEELRAFYHLDQTFTRLHWDLRDTSLKIQVMCQNAVIDLESKEDLESREKSLEEKISLELSEKCEILQQKLKSYFDEHENKDILVQWSARYKKNLENLCSDELLRLKRTMRKNVEIKIAQLETTDKASLFCREKITEIAMEAAKELRVKKKELSETEILQYFEKEWPIWLNKFGSTNEQTNPKDVVLSAISEELDIMFVTEKLLLNKQLEKNAIEHIEEFNFSTYSIKIKEKHLSFCTTWKETLKQFPFINCSHAPILSRATEKCNAILDDIKTYTNECYGSDFLNGQVTQVFRTLSMFFNNIDKEKDGNGFNFTKKFIVRFTIDICKCAATEFVKNKKHFQDVSDQLAEVKKRRPDFLKLFENTYNDITIEITAADWFSAEIYEWMDKSVFLSFGPVILNAVSTDESCSFDTKQKFLNTILIEIAEKNQFLAFTEYLKDRDCFYKKKIKQYVHDILNKRSGKERKTKLQVLVETECNRYASKIKDALEQLLLDKPFVNSMDYVAKLKRQFEMKSLDSKKEGSELVLFPTGRLDTLKTMQITEFERFTRLLIDKLPSIIDKNLKKLSRKTERYTKCFPVLEFSAGTDPIEFLSEKVLGCPARCPFCKMPCKYTFKYHYRENTQESNHSSVGRNQTSYHNAHQHCPHGLLGYHWSSNGKLITENCQSSVASESLIKKRDIAGASLKCKDYKKHYESWEIAPDRAMESSLYWKWFMCKFHNELLCHYGAKKADIPEKWKTISWEDAKKSLLNDY